MKWLREATMATMNVSLPDPLRDWVEAQVKTGRYANASDYVRDLIRRDQEAKDALIEALERGAASGRSRRTIEDIWQTAKRKTAGGKV
jgi:antitoxin ParD1/3/4